MGNKAMRLCGLTDEFYLTAINLRKILKIYYEYLIKYST